MDQSIIDSFAGQAPQSGPEACDTSSAQPSNAAMEVSAEPPGRPWLRFFARSFDILLFSVAAEAILCFVWPSLASRNFLLVGLVPGILLYCLTDALLMAAFGTTPGKYLLRIAVVPATWQPITLRQALVRSFNVGWHGLAFGLPVANLFKLFGARKRLLEKGETRWDEKGHFYVLHQEAGLLGPLLLVFFSALLVLTGSVLSYLISDRRPEVLPEYRSVKVASLEHALPSITSVIPNPPVLEQDGVPTPQATDPLSGTAPASSSALPASTTGRQVADSRQDAAQIRKMVMADLNQPVAAAKTPRQETGTAGRHVKQDAPPAIDRRFSHPDKAGQYAAPAITHQPAVPVSTPSEDRYAGRTLSGKKGTQQAKQTADRGSLGKQASSPVPDIVVHAAKKTPASTAAPGQAGGDIQGAATNLGRPAPGRTANASLVHGSATGSSLDGPGSTMINDQAAKSQDTNAGNAAAGAAIQADTPVTSNSGPVRRDHGLPPQQQPAPVQGAVAQDGGAPTVALGGGQIAPMTGDSPARTDISPDAARLPEEGGAGGLQAAASDISAAASPAPAPVSGRGATGPANNIQDEQAPPGDTGKFAALGTARAVVQDAIAASPDRTSMQPDRAATPAVTQQGAPVTADIAGVPTDFEQTVMHQVTAGMAGGGH